MGNGISKAIKGLDLFLKIYFCISLLKEIYFCLKMETMKNKIDLSDYAHVTILLNLYDGQSGVSITKKPYGKSMNDVAYLDLDEWKELSKNMLEIKRAAREMRERVDANELSDIPTPMYPCDVTKILSTKYLAKLNRFEAPTKQTYITLAIRPFTLDKGKEPRPNSKEGVTLNQAELSALADQVFVIQNIIAEQMTSTRFIHLVTQEDVEREKKRWIFFSKWHLAVKNVASFWKKKIANG